MVGKNFVCFCLQKKCKTKKYWALCSANISEKPCANKILGPFWAKKSKFGIIMVSIASCTDCVFARDLWQQFFFLLSQSITLPIKQFSFSVYSFPPPTLAPFSLHDSKYLFIVFPQHCYQFLLSSSSWFWTLLSGHSNTPWEMLLILVWRSSMYTCILFLDWVIIRLLIFNMLTLCRAPYSLLLVEESRTRNSSTELLSDILHDDCTACFVSSHRYITYSWLVWERWFL